MDKTKEKINHLAVTMTGSSAWSRERNLGYGHGLDKSFTVLKNSIFWLKDAGLSYLSVFFYSPEDYEQRREYVSRLLKRLKDFLSNSVFELQEGGVRLVFSGDTRSLPGDMMEILLEAEKDTQYSGDLTVNLCLNYSGQQEIIEALKKIYKQKLDTEQLHAGIIKKYLHQPHLPNPEKIVITGGRCGTNGFLLWQGASSELVFSNKLWPELEKDDFLNMLSKTII